MEPLSSAGDSRFLDSELCVVEYLLLVSAFQIKQTINISKIK